MAEATLTTVGAILKEVYGPRIEKQYVEELTALKRIERTSEGVVETVGGKYVDFPIKVRRNTGIGNRQENEQLPAAGKQGYAEVHVPLYYSYGRVRMTGQVMELAETNYQAFASAMDQEMDGVKDDRLDDDARQVYMNGTGLLTGITADGANTVTVTSTQYLEIGTRIDILVIATGVVLATNREITNIVGLVVTYDGADVVAVAGTHGLFRQGNFLAAAQREVTGFDKIVNTGELHNVNSATEPKWQATLMGNAGVDRALSEGLMIQAVDNIRIAGGGRPTVVFCGLGVRRSYFNLLVQQRRYTDTKEFAGGFTGLAFNHGKEIPVIDDPKSPPEQMLFISEPKVKVYRNKPYHFADADGSVLKWVTDYDAWEALIRQYWEIGTSQRNSHARLFDLIEG